MKYTISTVNFNNYDLTNACIQAVKTNIKNIDYNIIVVDNSTSVHYKTAFNDIRIIDNFNNRLNLDFEYTRHGDQSHSAVIQYLIDICNTDYLILLDSDFLLKKNLDFLLTDDCTKYITICQLDYGKNPDMTRLTPYLQVFNLKLFKKYNLKYYNKSNSSRTGHYLYLQLKDMNLLDNVKIIKYSQYGIHLLSGSKKTTDDCEKFLNDNK